MNCTGCNQDVHPVQELQQNGRTFMSRCPRMECGAPMDPAPVRELMAHGERGVIPVPPSVAVPGPVHVRELPQESRRDPLPEPGDLIGQMRLRLQAIEAQVADMDRLQREAKKLRALLAAADAADDEGLN